MFSKEIDRKIEKRRGREISYRICTRENRRTRSKKAFIGGEERFAITPLLVRWRSMLSLGKVCEA